MECHLYNDEAYQAEVLSTKDVDLKFAIDFGEDCLDLQGSPGC